LIRSANRKDMEIKNYHDSLFTVNNKITVYEHELDSLNRIITKLSRKIKTIENQKFNESNKNSKIKPRTTNKSYKQ